MAYCVNSATTAMDLFGAKVVYMHTSWQCQYDPLGSVGYPLLDVFEFMKDKWDKGKQVIGILGIKTFQDFCDAIKNELEGKVKEKIDEICDDGLCFNELMLADVAAGGFSGYECNSPTTAEIISAIGNGRTVYSVSLTKIDPDISVMGSIKFMSGCNFKWKIVYE